MKIQDAPSTETRDCTTSLMLLCLRSRATFLRKAWPAEFLQLVVAKSYLSFENREREREKQYCSTILSITDDIQSYSWNPFQLFCTPWMKWLMNLNLLRCAYYKYRTYIMLYLKISQLFNFWQQLVFFNLPWYIYCGLERCNYQLSNIHST